MPSELTQLNFGFGRQVPQGAIPLSYINMPIPNIGTNLNLVGTGKYTVENRNSLFLKNEAPSISIFQKNLLNTFTTSGVIIDNKISDPSFLYGFVPTTFAIWNVVSGSWDWNQTKGRTTQNSNFESGDDPAIEQGTTAELPCATITWSSTGDAELLSNSITARTTESSYSISNIVYQLSFWIATDPVDSSNHRISSTGQKQSVLDTRIIITIGGYDNSDVFIENVYETIIGWPYYDTRSFLTQHNTVYLKFKSPFFVLPDSSITKLKIKIEGLYAQGVYFDDLRLRSYYYIAQNIDTGNAAWLYGNPGQTNYQNLAGVNQLLNPNLIDNDYLDGDFYNVFKNVIPDPSFEIGLWSVVGAAGNSVQIRSAPYHGNSARTGNAYASLGSSSGTVEILLAGLNNNFTYTFSGWLKISNALEDGTTCNVSIDYLDNSNTVLGSSGTHVAVSHSTYTNFTFTFSSVAFSGTTKWLVKIQNPNALVGIGDGTIAVDWDDIQILGPGSPIPHWTFLPGQPLNNGTGVLAYGEAYNNFAFTHYLTGTDEAHFAYSRMTIFKNNTFVLDKDFTDRYFNTEHIMYADYIPVQTNQVYGLNFSVRWPGYIPNLILDGDATIRGAFAEPFKIIYTDPRGSGFGIHDVTGYGSLKAIVQGVNASGNVTETPISYEIGPRNGNLPNNNLYDAKTGWNYSQVAPPRFEFTNSQTVSGVVTFIMTATMVGLNSITLNQYTFAASSTLSNYTIKVYSFSNKITADSIYEDETGAWRLAIKDGIFERKYTVSEKEPADSWLRQVGFKTGEELVLVYTVPEYNLGTQWIDVNDPTNLKHIQEIHRTPCRLVDDKTIFLGNQNILHINEILINGTVVATGSISGTTAIQILLNQYPNLVKSVDLDKGTITLNRTINENDLYEASYFYKELRYIYRGFQVNGIWHDLDLNPGAGHRWNFGLDGIGQPGYNLINNPVTIYLIPSAAYIASGDVSGVYNYNSAFDVDPSLRQTNFVQHVAGITITEDSIPWVPSAAIIGKIFITPPGSINDVEILDIRSRGGGLPEDWDYNNEPTNFIEETRVRIPVADNTWLNSGVILYPGDYVTIVGYGWASGSTGNPYRILPNNSLWANINTTTPTTTGGTNFIGNYWTATISNHTYLSSGIRYSASGILFFKVINPLKGNSGELFALIRIKRKFFRGSIWDFKANDGDPVMLNGVNIVSVPGDILTGSNGYRKFTHEQIQEIADKHTAAGTLAIIKYE